MISEDISGKLNFETPANRVAKNKKSYKLSVPKEADISRSGRPNDK